MNTFPDIVLLPVLLPFVFAILGLLFRGLVAQRATGILGSLTASIAGVILLQQTIDTGHVVTYLSNWKAPFGITFVADIFSAIMVLVSCVTTLLVACFACQQVKEEEQRGHLFPLFNFLLMGVNGAFLTGDLFNLYVWFEVILISSFILLTVGGRRAQIEGAFKYVAINLVASMFFLAGAGLVYSIVGTLNMADLAVKIAAAPNSYLINTTTMLFLVAFGIKAALFPFFFWLPASYHTASLSVCALFAGLLTKVGVYALIRSYTLFFETSFADIQPILLWVAGFTMVTGVLGAAAQFNIRKILTFHVVSQIGYLIMGLAIASTLSFAATIFYLVHIILVKTNLILIGGIVERICGTSELSRTGNLYKHKPYLATLFLLSALALAGIPPFSGFWAKFSLIRSGIEGEFFWITGVALFVGVLTLFSMTKIWSEAFWKKAPEDAEQNFDTRSIYPSYIPILLITAVIIYLGLDGSDFYAICEQAAKQLADSSEYIQAVLPAEYIAKGQAL